METNNGIKVHQESYEELKKVIGKPDKVFHYIYMEGRLDKSNGGTVLFFVDNNKDLSYGMDIICEIQDKLECVFEEAFNSDWPPTLVDTLVDEIERLNIQDDLLLIYDRDKGWVN